MDLQIDRVDIDSVVPNSVVHEQDDIIIAACPPTMIPLIWDRAAPLLELPIALAHGEVTLDTMKKKLLMGESLLITVSRGTEIIAVNTVEVRHFESGLKALYIPLIGGTEMEEWMDRFLNIVSAIGKDLGCTELRGIAARKGWIRRLKPLGWSEVSTIIKCDI